MEFYEISEDFFGDTLAHIEDRALRRAADVLPGKVRTTSVGTLVRSSTPGDGLGKYRAHVIVRSSVGPTVGAKVAADPEAKVQLSLTAAGTTLAEVLEDFARQVGDYPGEVTITGPFSVTTERIYNPPRLVAVIKAETSFHQN